MSEYVTWMTHQHTGKVHAFGPDGVSLCGYTKVGCCEVRGVRAPGPHCAICQELAQRSPAPAVKPAAARTEQLEVRIESGPLAGLPMALSIVRRDETRFDVLAESFTASRVGIGGDMEKMDVEFIGGPFDGTRLRLPVRRCGDRDLRIEAGSYTAPAPAPVSKGLAK